MSNNHGETEYIMGDVFLRKVIAIFDMDEERIGIATKKNGTKN